MSHFDGEVATESEENIFGIRTKMITPKRKSANSKKRSKPSSYNSQEESEFESDHQLKKKRPKNDKKEKATSKTKKTPVEDKSESEENVDQLFPENGVYEEPGKKMENEHKEKEESRQVKVLNKKGPATPEEDKVILEGMAELATKTEAGKWKWLADKLDNGRNADFVRHRWKTLVKKIAEDVAVCKQFRITSPIDQGLVLTNGQCYQISFDPGNGWINTVARVELLESSSNRVVSLLWSGQLRTFGKISTPYFNMNLGRNPQTGIYYYRVAARLPENLDNAECLYSTVWFKVIAESYEMADCPK
ncbi:hypothetical protein G9A89_001740 [Geosiphon pyriformis]|nr:hypothetical protein G9A89_001740 [Geosiphon pyriformis]